MVLTVLVVLGVGTYGMKAFGPLVLGGRALPARVARLAELLPAPLLAGLVVVSSFVSDGSYVLDARAAGIAAAAVALVARLPFVAVVLAAAGTTALVRLVA